MAINTVHGHRSLAEIARLIEESSLRAAGKARADPLFAPLRRPKRPSTTCRSSRYTCTRSARSTRSSTFSARSSRSNGSASTTSSRRRSTSAAGRSNRRRRVSGARAGDARLLAGAPVYSGGSRRNSYADRRTAADATTRGVRPDAAMTVDRRLRRGDPGFLPRAERPRVVIGERDGRPTGTRRRLDREDRVRDRRHEPQLFGPVTDRLFAAGALDVF